MTTIEADRSVSFSGAALVFCASAVLLVTAAAMAMHGADAHTRDMAVHVVLMNVAAPLAVIAIFDRSASSSVSVLWAASLLQVTALWVGHLPVVHHAFALNLPLRLAGDASLFAIALLFWRSVLTQQRSQRWQAIAALLITGKLVCLLAALLVFAPRALYDIGHSAHALRDVAMSDQQLAGLLMIAACPLSYIGTAIVMTVALVNGSGNSPHRSMRPR